MPPVSAPKEKECPACALAIGAETETCPFCGYVFPVEPPSRLFLVALFALLFAIWAVHLLFAYLF